VKANVLFGKLIAYTFDIVQRLKALASLEIY